MGHAAPRPSPLSFAKLHLMYTLLDSKALGKINLSIALPLNVRLQFSFSKHFF